ncbi:MAG: YerC/YecD family TrpR-related protein [Syntrophomonadaceae bacterium]|nr:YerC/YecD family TrpR-related protein [Syntrophomonadaceae bacterium]
MGFEPKWKNENSDLLVRAILSLKNEDEVYRFLDDICTISEVRVLAQRIAVAGLLGRDITYNDISAATGASTATISRVNRSRLYGSGGYAHILKALEETGDEA